VADRREDRWVHVGEAYVYVDEPERLASRPAPTRETVRAGELAAELREFQRDPASAITALEELVRGAEAATEPVEKVIKLAEDLTRVPDPAIAAAYAERVAVRIVRDYRESRFRDVVRLVGALASLYLLYEKWRGLVAVLQLDRLAAEQLGDAAEAARAVNDLGVLADAAGVAPLAGELFEQARELFEQTGEHAAETAGQAAGLAPQAAAHAGVALGVKVAAVAAGALVVAGGAAGFAVGDGAWYGVGGNEEAREGGDAEILWFSAGDDSVIPGSFSEQAGFTRPEGAVGPGDTLGACEPLYVYDYTRFENMVSGTPYVTRMTRGEELDASSPGTWEGSAEFTEGNQTHRGSGSTSNGEAVPYGEWELVVEIDGVEVDRESFTLEEDCTPD
jgi:hypothetical protein